MKLSVIIVNYNVKHFLEQCLLSVEKALKGIDSEVIVVDNNSVDGSSLMVREKFRNIHLIENERNRGFSFANNQAIRISSGEYILLLNPDTVVEEKTFRVCINFMDNQPEAGGLSVKLINGKGKFLPESKRALPTPAVAFYKIFGISSLFPKSRIFGKYHLGYLDPDKIHVIDVLPGAFMFLRKEALDKTGMLDEDFFMYGEDIDLSYRLIQNGYRIFYCPDTTIIHYKGESTKKGSLNYVLQFYKAMIIYANKHLSKKNRRSFRRLINLAIYFRAIISITKRIFHTVFLPVSDALIIYAGIYLIKPFWEQFKFTGGHYPDEFMMIVVPVYIVIWIGSILFAGGYDKKINLMNTAKGILLGTGIILIIYALLPTALRFSRAMILFGAAWAFLSTLLARLLLHLLNIEPYRIARKKGKRVLIIGNKEESERVRSILINAILKPEIIGTVLPTTDEKTENYVGHTGQIEDLVRINRVEEIIFCSKDITTEEIIRNMMVLTHTIPDFKIAPPESYSIIGSNSIETTGDLYLIRLNSISSPENKRNKRFLDLLVAFLLIIFFPFMLLLTIREKGLFRNIVLVFAGKRSWVGYYKSGNTGYLPAIRDGILSPAEGLGPESLNEKTIHDINLVYAKDYKLKYDLLIILKGFRKLGR